MPTTIEINNPELKYCKLLDIHCKCPKCTNKKKRMCTSTCKFCENIIQLIEKKCMPLTASETLENIKETKSKCLPSCFTYTARWELRNTLIENLLKTNLSEKEKIIKIEELLNENENDKKENENENEKDKKER